MGGEAGNSLVERMGLEASPETLLRLVRQQEEHQIPTPRVLGVDDFCFCRRRSYGAILIDLERRVPIDLLPDRAAETFKKWRLSHPGVEIISRDRGGSFAEGARQGARNPLDKLRIGGMYCSTSVMLCRVSFSPNSPSQVPHPRTLGRSLVGGFAARASSLAYRNDQTQ